MPWTLAALLLAARTSAAPQHPFRPLQDFKYTCLVPAKENESLRDTAMAKQLSAAMLSKYGAFNDTATGFIERRCRYNPLPQCREEVRRTIGDMAQVSPLEGIPDCKNFTGAEIADRCSNVPAGKFCFVVQGNASMPTCMLVQKDGYYATNVVCPAGFVCAGRDTQPVTCPKGYFCPIGSNQMLPCPPGHFCPVAAVNISCDKEESPFFSGTVCLPDQAGRTMNPLPCPSGSFCVGGLRHRCPRDHFCPQGSDEPIRCSMLEICGEGKAMPNRVPRALGEFALFSVSFALFLVSLECWCLVPSYWWFRLTMGLLVVGGLWMDELSNEQSVNVIPALTTIFAVIVIWGSYINPRMMMWFPGWLTSVLEVLIFGAGALAAAFCLDELTVGGFVVVLISPVVSTYIMFERGVSSVGRFLVMLTGAFLNIAAIAMLPGVQGPKRAVVYFSLLLLFLLIESVRCFLALRQSGKSLHDRKVSEFKASDAVNSAVAPPVQRWQPEHPGEHAASPRGMTSGMASMASGMASATSLEIEGAKPARGVSFGLSDISLVLPSGQVILDQISLTIPAGNTVAVMGPSGCGKSSIMNVLSGRAGYGDVRGTIRINGSSNHSIKDLRHFTGFVPQDDIMHTSLTVEENVRFQAELRMPQKARGLGVRAIGEGAAKETLRVLNLLGIGSESLRSSRIGSEDVRGISGGERKRVSIAMEFVACPSLLFLDEPTSGLDSTTSQKVVDAFTKAAKERECTTIACVHQPRYETLCLFEQLILLAPGGYLVFSGRTEDVEGCFKSVLRLSFPSRSNPADVLLDAIILESAREMMERNDMLHWEGTDDVHKFGRWLRDRFRNVNKQLEADVMPGGALPRCNGQGWGLKIGTHMIRCAVQIQRDLAHIVTNNAILGIGVFAYCLSGPKSLPQDDILHPCLALDLLMLTQGVAAQRIFGGNERYILWREAGVAVNPILCFLGRDITAFIDIILGSMIFTTIYWPMGPLMSNHHTVFWVSFAFTYAIFGLNYIWSILMNPALAQMTGVVSCFVCFILAGVQPPFVTMISFLGGSGLNLMALSPMRWALGIFMQEASLSRGAAISNMMIQSMAKARLTELGMPMEWIKESGWSCRSSMSCFERSVGDPDNGVPPNSLVCFRTQLLLLGMFYRIVALLCLFITSRKHAQGGGSLIDDPNLGRVRTKGRPWKMVLKSPRLLKKMLVLILVMFTDVEMCMLLRTR